MEEHINIKLIIGLGNPGEEYENTMHNTGEIFVSYLASAPKLEREEASFEYAKMGNIILVRPKVFMNESGIAVKEAVKKFKVKPEEILIAQDDSDIFLGEYKLSFGRGSAGHKGIQSIMNYLDTKDFWRLRIGIRKSSGRAGDFVLQKFSKEDLKNLYLTFEGIKLKVAEKENP